MPRILRFVEAYVRRAVKFNAAHKSRPIKHSGGDIGDKCKVPLYRAGRVGLCHAFRDELGSNTGEHLTITASTPQCRKQESVSLRITIESAAVQPQDDR